MINKLLILMGIFVIAQLRFSLSCLPPFSYQIKIEEKKVYFIGNGMKELKNIDYETFETIDIPYSKLAKDKNNVYFKGEKTELDSKTFKVEKVLYDKQTVSYYEEISDKGVVIRIPEPKPSCGGFPYLILSDKNSYYLSREFSGVSKLTEERYRYFMEKQYFND